MSFTTSNMGLVIPTVGVDVGPTYATLIDAAFVAVDSHNHSSGQGVQITPAGLNISSDLTFAQNNATNLRTARFYNNSSITLGVNDLTCLYALNNELYYEDGAGNSVQITSSGSLNLGTVSSLTLKDSQFVLEYFGDTTRKARFDVSNVPGSTTRIYKLPTVSANDTLASLTATQTLTATTLTGGTVSGCTAVNLISGSGTLTLPTSGTITIPNGTDTLVALALSQTLTNKILTGNTIASFTPNGGTNTITVPAITDTLVTKTTTDTLTNKTLTSPAITAPAISGSGTITSATVITDVSDATKEIAFSVSGNTTGKVLTIASQQTNSETLSVPNITGADTITTLGLAQTISAAKTFTAAINMNAQNKINFYNSGSTFATSLNGGANSANYAIVLPIADGTSGQVVKTDGSGNWGWASASTFASADVATSATIAALASSTSMVRMTGSTATTIQGITAGSAGQIIRILNVSSALITLSNQNSSATAANRILLPNGFNEIIYPNYAFELQYDATQSRWTPLSDVDAQTVMGNQTGTAPITGFIGEQLISSVTSVSTASSGNYGDVTSLSLTAGVWDVYAYALISLNGATGVSGQTAGISSTSGNSGTGLTQGLNRIDFLPPTSSGSSSVCIPAYRVIISSTTTYYFKMQITYSTAAPLWFGSLKAIRVG